MFFYFLLIIFGAAGASLDVFGDKKGRKFLYV
jgi:hypothetical protein